ncbi:MAG: hypothetical protein AB7O91_08445 [Sphingomonas sp.]
MTDPRNEADPAAAVPDAAQPALPDAPLDEDVADFDESEEGEEGDEEFDGPYRSEDFHNVTHKLVMHAVSETLRDTKLDWTLVAPFLESAREMAYADFQEADVRIHTVRADGEEWVEAEEAYLGLSVADRDSGEEWLAATYWLSELAMGEDDPEQVRRIISAVERSLEKMRAWIAEKEAGGAGEPAPPADGAPS